MKANTKHEILVEFCNVRGSAGDEEEPIKKMYLIFFISFSFFLLTEVIVSGAGWLRLGGAEVQDSDTLFEQAVDLAKDADVVVAIVGLTDEWETEGNDRTTLALPGRTDELIARVAAVNAKTVVVTQAVCVVVLSSFVSHISEEIDGSSIGLCDNHALGHFGTCNRACLVPWQCMW